MLNLQDFSNDLDAARIRIDALIKPDGDSIETLGLVPMWEELQSSLTELSVAEEELHEQEDALAAAAMAIDAERRRYQNLFELAPDGYLVTDAFTIVLEANRSAAQMLNIPQNRLVRKPLAAFVARTDRPEFRLQITQLGRLSRINNWEIMLRPRDRAPFLASLTVSVARRPNGEIAGYYWMVRDLSARKRVEAEQVRLLRQAERVEDLLEEQVKVRTAELAAASAEKDALLAWQHQFIGTASHELRTQLTLIKGYLQLGARQLKLEGREPTIAEGLMLDLLGHTDRFEALLENLLSTSHLRTGELDLHPAPCDLRELAQQVLERFKYAPDRKAEHSLEFDAPEPVQGIWDASRLEEVVTNLVSNALRYSPQGGRIGVTVRSNGEEAQIVVSDEGLGIPVEEQERLFEPYFRGRVTQEIAGTGLGLHITSQIVERHGGRIDVESYPDNGSTFTVRLPLEVVGNHGGGLQ